MKKVPIIYVALFAIVIGLMVITSVNGARSALIYSDDYISDFEMYHIGITLQEFGDGETDYKPVGWRNYAPEKEGEDTVEATWVVNNDIPLFQSINNFVVGKTYSERFNVVNSGSIDEYVRVKVYKYWLDPKGNKDTTLSPDLIELGLVDDDNWIIDNDDTPTRTTNERTVLYYSKILKIGESTPDFMETLKINNGVYDRYEVSSKSYKENEKTYTNVVYKYVYDGYTFCVEIEADAVQTHNAVDAIKSSWGRDVVIDSNGKLSLKN